MFSRNTILHNNSSIPDTLSTAIPNACCGINLKCIVLSVIAKDYITKAYFGIQKIKALKNCRFTTPDIVLLMKKSTAIACFVAGSLVKSITWAIPGFLWKSHRIQHPIVLYFHCIISLPKSRIIFVKSVVTTSFAPGQNITTSIYTLVNEYNYITLLVVSHIIVLFLIKEQKLKARKEYYTVILYVM